MNTGQILNTERDITMSRILRLSSSIEEHTQRDICRGASVLGHAKRTSLICIILTTCVVACRVFRGIRASSAHNSTNIGNCSANWNSSSRDRHPLAPPVVAMRADVVVVVTSRVKFSLEIVSSRIVVADDKGVVELRHLRMEFPRINTRSSWIRRHYSRNGFIEVNVSLPDAVRFVERFYRWRTVLRNWRWWAHEWELMM